MTDRIRTSTRDERTRTTAQRAQSETLGFSIVFGIVVFTVVIISATAFPGLLAVQQHHQVNNVERGFGVFADNVDDVATHAAPRRGTELPLAGGHLEGGSPVQLTISGEAVDDPNQTFQRTFELQPLVYRSPSGPQFVYVNGAVIRDESGVVMVREPELLFSNEQTVLQVIQPTAPDRTVAGKTRTMIATARNGSEVVAANHTAYNVTISITTPRADAWERYFERQPGLSCSRTSETVSCDLQTQDLYVTVVYVDVEYD